MRKRTTWKNIFFCVIVIVVIYFIASSFSNPEKKGLMNQITQQRGQLESCTKTLNSYNKDSNIQGIHTQVLACSQRIKKILETVDKLNSIGSDSDSRAMQLDYRALDAYFEAIVISTNLSLNSSYSRADKIMTVREAKLLLRKSLDAIAELQRTYSTTSYYHSSYGTSVGERQLEAFKGEVSNSLIAYSETLSILTHEKPIAVYVDALPYGVDPSYMNVVDEASDYWRKRDNATFKRVSTEREADVRIQWVKEFGGEHLGYTLGKNFVEIGLGDSFCLEKWRAYTYEDVAHIAKHELGHVLGYDHDSTDEIMQPATLTHYTLDLNESDTLPEGWHKSYHLCTKNSLANYELVVMSDIPLTIYILPSKEEQQKMADGKSFYQYSSCSIAGTKSYLKSCTITRGSYVTLYLPKSSSSSATRFTLTAKELLSTTTLTENSKSLASLPQQSPSLPQNTQSQNPVTSSSSSNTAQPSSQSYICDQDVYNCNNFKTQAEAQRVFEACGGVAHDVHHLDSNKDGRACESLP